jgi:hypothetical protein
MQDYPKKEITAQLLNASEQHDIDFSDEGWIAISRLVRCTHSTITIVVGFVTADRPRVRINSSLV